jgi:Na+-driven multidrug efflux pump
MILQAAINGNGTDAVTGIAVGGKIMSFFWIFFSVFESALLNFCSQNIGAKEYARVKRGIRSTLFVFLGIGAAFALLALTGIDRFVYMAFVGDSESMLEISHNYYLTQIIFFPFIAMLFTWRAGLKAFGSTVPTLLCGVAELIARLLVSFFFADNLFMLFFAGPMAWVFSSVLVSILYPIAEKKEFRGKIPVQKKERRELETAKR